MANHAHSPVLVHQPGMIHQDLLSGSGSSSVQPPVAPPGNVHQGGHHHPPHQQQQLSPSYQQPTPWTISEANSHCVHVFDKLRVQREQSRFADLILSVRGREFAAHRCVLAACSPWFDARLKVHKSTREHIAIDQCKDYEIFYALLTYIYTGNLVLDQVTITILFLYFIAYSESYFSFLAQCQRALESFCAFPNGQAQILLLRVSLQESQCQKRPYGRRSGHSS